MRVLGIGTWALLFAAMGCLGTSTGNPVDAKKNDGTLPDDDDDSRKQGGDPTSDFEGDGALGGFCQGGEATELAVDAESPLAFSGADILAFASGTHERSMRWNPLPNARYGPEQGQSTITVELSHAGGKVRHVGPPSASGDTDDVDFGGPGFCTAYLELDVDVHVRTAGGALDERLSGTLRAGSELVAVLFVRPDPDMLGGSFAVTQTDQGFTLAQLDLSIAFTPFGMSGSLDAFLERRDGDGVTSGGSVSNSAGGDRPLAEWGLESCYGRGYPVSLSDDLAGLRPQAVLDAIANVDAASITWKPDGQQTAAQVAFAPTGDGACFNLGPSAGDGIHLSLPGRLSLRSDDGRLDADLPGALTATVLPGQAPERAEFQIDDSFGWADRSAEETAAAYGFAMVAVDGFDFLSVQLEVRIALGDPATLAGELILRGHVLADCARDPVGDPDAEPGEADPGDADDPGEGEAGEGGESEGAQGDPLPIPDEPIGGASGSDGGGGTGGAGGSDGETGGGSSSGASTPGCAGSTSTDILVGALG